MYWCRYIYINRYMDAPKPEDGEIKLTVPTGLIPYCPRCGKPMSMNQDEAYAPEEIRRKSVCMNEDVGEVLKEL